MEKENIWDYYFMVSGFEFLQCLEEGSHCTTTSFVMFYVGLYSVWLEEVFALGHCTKTSIIKFLSNYLFFT